ncbi:hypothetical protein [Blochmannia endosymbiont of Camponotus (Colobopsis) obliquus]|uniref:hypothetical protein n=1 Tax=Blochmannia endosymbiont of Camponotus (Colobopsis) obliquus TaxID=1505597 RepID=UPI00061A9DE1|nr:hypothetical protein [Blochmannia endosymbiont of Camponotus (Colobopsis) obliquus]
MNCGYKFTTYENLYSTHNVKNITFYNLESYHLLANMIKTELNINNFNLIKDKNHLNITTPSVQIINVFENNNKIDIIQNNILTKFQLTLKIKAKIIISSTTHTVNIKINRYYFTNHSMPLTRDSEIKNLRKEIYQQAAQQLVCKLLNIIINAK